MPGSNRLAQSISGQDVVQYGYDNAGSLVSRNSTTFTYNADHRLVGVSSGSALAEYGYDYRGLRSLSTVNGKTTHFVYDPSGQVIREYVYLDGQPLARFDYKKVGLSAPSASTAPDSGNSAGSTSFPTGANTQWIQVL